MTIEVTPAEKRVVELLREIKGTSGHGSLRIEVAEGKEILFKKEHSEKPPR